MVETPEREETAQRCHPRGQGDQIILKYWIIRIAKDDTLSQKDFLQRSRYFEKGPFTGLPPLSYHNIIVPIPCPYILKLIYLYYKR